MTNKCNQIQMSSNSIESPSPLPIQIPSSTRQTPDIESQAPTTTQNTEEQTINNNDSAWRNKAGMAVKVGGMILAASGAAAEHAGADSSVSKSLKGAGILMLVVSLGLENPFQNEEHRTKANLTAKVLRTGAVILGIASVAASDKTTGIFAILSQAVASTIEITPKAINAAKNFLNKLKQNDQIEERGQHAQAVLERRQNNNNAEQLRN